MATLSIFLYGMFTGVIVVVLFILYGFDTVSVVMRGIYRLLEHAPFLADMVRTARRQDHSHNFGAEGDGMMCYLNFPRGVAGEGGVGSALQELGYEGVERYSTSTSPLKHSAECTLTWLEGDCAGSPMDCRVAVLDRTVTVYERLPMQSDDNTTCTTAEHIIGKIHLSRTRAVERKITGKERRNIASAFSGRVLIVWATEDQPLFLPHELEAPTTSSPLPGAGEAVHDLNWYNIMTSQGYYTGYGGSLYSDQCNVYYSTCEPFVVTPFTEYHISGSQDAELLIQQRQVDVHSWRCIVIKFASAREVERWRCIFLDDEEISDWRSFVRSMPNTETANLFISRFFFQNMRDKGLAEAIRSGIRKKLQKVSVMKFPRMLRGQILLDDFVIGRRIPWISDVSDPTVSSNGEMAFDLNLHYKGEEEAFSLYFRLALTFYGIRIPHIVLILKLLELETTLHVSIGPPPSKKFWIGGHKPPMMRLKVSQGTASGKGILHRILTSLPDLSNTFTNLLKLYFFSDIILPYMDDFPLPNMNKSPPHTPVEKVLTFDWRKAAMMSGAPVPRQDMDGLSSTPQPTRPSAPNDAASPAALKPNSTSSRFSKHGPYTYLSGLFHNHTAQSNSPSPQNLAAEGSVTSTNGSTGVFSGLFGSGYFGDGTPRNRPPAFIATGGLPEANVVSATRAVGQTDAGDAPSSPRRPGPAQPFSPSAASSSSFSATTSQQARRQRLGQQHGVTGRTPDGAHNPVNIPTQGSFSSRSDNDIEAGGAAAGANTSGTRSGSSPPRDESPQARHNAASATIAVHRRGGRQAEKEMRRALKMKGEALSRHWSNRVAEEKAARREAAATRKKKKVA